MLDRLNEFSILLFKLTEQFVICLNLPVDFTTLWSSSFLLNYSCGNSFVYSRLFIKRSDRKHHMCVGLCPSVSWIQKSAHIPSFTKFSCTYPVSKDIFSSLDSSVGKATTNSLASLLSFVFSVSSTAFYKTLRSFHSGERLSSSYVYFHVLQWGHSFLLNICFIPLAVSFFILCFSFYTDAGKHTEGQKCNKTAEHCSA